MPITKRVSAPPSLFPVLEAVNTSEEASPTTSHDADLPAGIQAGDLLIVLYRLNEAGVTATVPSGWTGLTGDIGFYRTATGSEGGTVTLTTSAVTGSVHNSFRVSGHLGDPESAATDLTGDPPPLTPSWGREHALWIASVLAYDAEPGEVDVTAVPDGYTGLIKTEQYSQAPNRLLLEGDEEGFLLLEGDAQDNGDKVLLEGDEGLAIAAMRLASAVRRLKAASEDPGTFETVGASDAFSSLLAIRAPAPNTTNRVAGAIAANATRRVQGRAFSLLLAGDQSGGHLLLAGDVQSGSDRLQLAGDQSGTITANQTRRVTS